MNKMNNAELIKRMQQRAAARAAARAASATGANKSENAQNATVNQSSGWRRVVDAYAEKTAERAVFERCAKCCFTKQADWCYWMDSGGETEWLHHWVKTSTCRNAPVRPGGTDGYMTLAQRDREAGLAMTAGGQVDRKAAAAAAKAAEQEAARIIALEFWARNQTVLEAAGWIKEAVLICFCRAGVELGTAEIEGEYIVFNKWTKARARKGVE